MIIFTRLFVFYPVWPIQLVCKHVSWAREDALGPLPRGRLLAEYLAAFARDQYGRRGLLGHLECP